MRTEEIAAKALEKTGNDRYVLSNLVFARTKELSNGAKPLVDGVDLKIHKLADIAMMEIAQDKIAFTGIDANLRR
ncbi:DNA-directed RNA polymerase subunit omega [Helicobacter kayseriensis]|uniref:DNA-directed RNA polymerase subunit omega n=1 Tax=Helicobacter kayseriensis TaxID=2905877 RepID=UPI001E3A2A72|nr:DNA-directed RNA polymerase subunit omega [Helicobacter kayseriensis]MCE3047625.1 DNA-directed RNA polymerase subunit omega [Helicobacter kayseriensis]MCE3049023.1 DNA-directed RNA polymerase subunit omega [Helicobacter kayseriensis]